MARERLPERVRNWHGSCRILYDMFGVPDREPSLEQDLELLEAAPSKLFRLLETEEEEAPWPQGSDPSVLFLLNERISPRPLRLRDRPLLLALAVSVLFHFLIFYQLRENSLLLELLASQKLAAKLKTEDNTPFFEIVEMPKQKAEKPSRAKPPASDLDRRAHGGIGAPALTPGSRGNTPEMRLEPPPGFLAPKPPGADGAEKIAKAPGQDTSEESKTALADKGADAVLMTPREGGGAPKYPGLKGITGYGALGSGGGLVPNRQGGQVDLGPLSFDTEGYDWGPYAAEMLRRIRYHWDIPEIAQMGVPGVVRIHFFIERDGRVTGLEIQRFSGHPPLDFAARDAILNASPLPPLPEDLGGLGHEGVTITFFYNTPVPERSDRG
jgi:TonB family protein